MRAAADRDHRAEASGREVTDGNRGIHSLATAGIRAAPLALLTWFIVIGTPALGEENSEWAKSFVSSALQTYLGNNRSSLIVVPAGSDTPELHQATDALQVGLRTTGKVGLVMDAQSLGAVGSLDDQEIIKRCANVPVDLIVVLRAFPDGSGKISTAVVSLYDKSGQNVDAFTAEAGKPILAKGGNTRAGEGLSSQAADTVSKALARSAQASSSVQEDYDLHYIGFDDVVAVYAYTGAPVRQWTVPYEGKYKKLLQGSAFYEKIGRQDLVQAYESKDQLKTGLKVGGVAAMIGGAALIVWAALPQGQENCGSVSSPGFAACVGRNVNDNSALTKGLIGAGLGAGGAGLLWAGFAINPHPVDASQARGLAEEYNHKLKNRLGLASSDEPVSSPRPQIQVAVAPLVTRSGGGLSLGISF